MPRSARKPKHITLGRFQRWDPATKTILRDRDSEKRAEETSLKRATPERASKADETYVGQDRLTQYVHNAPLDVLYARLALSKDRDRDTNKALFDAGDRFRQAWFNAGLVGVQAQDLNRTGGGGAPTSFPFSEFACSARDEVNRAVSHMGDYLGRYVVEIVGRERSLQDVGMELTGRMTRAVAIAVSEEALRGGLTSLAQHYGIIRPPRVHSGLT